MHHDSLYADIDFENLQDIETYMRWLKDDLISEKVLGETPSAPTPTVTQIHW